MDPGNFNLPAILDPVLIYLEDNLPPPLYNILLNLLSHCLAILTALTGLVASLISKNPLEWDAQTIIPPLITFLAVYLALLSIYRTTSWMIRTSFWFMKWGAILGALVAGLGWYMGATQNQAGGLMSTSLVSYFGNTIMDMINGQNRNAVGGDRNTQRTRRASTRRPKPWDSFDRHREWQYREDSGEGGETSELETWLNTIIGAAGQVMKNDWTGLKDIMGQSSETTEESGRRTRRKASSKSQSR